METQNEQQKAEWLACAESPIYFLDRYGWIYDATARKWIRFRLWKDQVRALKDIRENRLVVILKARQLGITWLVLGFALWMMLFHPAATILIFSRRDDEAVYILGAERMRGMYDRLPAWLKVREIVSDNGHEWMLSNGSIARAFPTSAGDSYTASLVVVDEADLAPDLGRLMNSVKPTIDGGGRMVMLSRSDNTKPESQFKKIYAAAKARINGWKSIFIPWFARPERDAAWYEEQKADIQSRTGSLDDLHQQYPSTDSEALAAKTLDKRIAPEWIIGCYVAMKPIRAQGSPAIPGLNIYKAPMRGERFVIGSDPAEGNPTSDNSSLHVLNETTGEEVAHLAGKFQPSTLGSHIDVIGKYFNNAAVLVERNNHGHAVLLWLRDNSKLRIISGPDGKDGWNTTSLAKALMYGTAADAFRDHLAIIHSEETMNELTSIEGSSLSAPEGQHDDRAVSFSLALHARQLPRYTKMHSA